MEKNVERKFYWIKLTEDFMMSDAVDFLMGQKDGANYVVLYQMLCLKTMNSNGELQRKLGEFIVPFDEEKIQRDCKYFEIDTIRVALELYKKLGLIYENQNGIFVISDYKNLVGKEGGSAKRMRALRERKSASHCDKKVTVNVTQELDSKIVEYRDKILDNRAKILETELLLDSTGDIDQQKRKQLMELGGTLGRGKVLISDEQFDDLFEKLSFAEFNLYIGKMADMIENGYSFSCSHYMQILKMVEQDRRVLT